MKKIKGMIRYDKEIEITGVRYSLKGVLVHWGVMEHGHYISVI
jgi:ubiquitin C-terminal hydrolase